MSPLPDAEAPLPPHTRDPEPKRSHNQTGTRTTTYTGTQTGTSGRLLLLRLLGALVAAVAVGATAGASFVWLSRRENPQQVPTAAHALLSAGSLTLPPGPTLRYEKGIDGVFLSGDVRLRGNKLEVTAGGLYLLYGQFSLTCVSPTCPPGTVTLQLRREGSPRPVLTMTLTLPHEVGSDPISSGLAQAVGQLRAGDLLNLALDGDVDGDEWQLAQEQREDNFVGLLRLTRGD